MPGYENDRVVRALRGESLDRTPIWMMRQAGRTDPAYLALRESSGLALEDLFRHPELAARITLLPQRFGVDALILFQDILTPLTPLGAHFRFRPGPELETPLRRPEQAQALAAYDVDAALGFVGETLERVRSALDGALPVLGFAGAPFTLLTFMVQGRSFGDAIPETLDFVRTHPEAAHAALETITGMTVAYLERQAAWGAAAVQLFESAAHLVPEDLYRAFALPYQQAIFGALRGRVPTIHFARELGDLGLLDAAGADVISLPSAIGIDAARRALGAERVFQGNLDNHLLAHGPMEAVRAAAEACVRAGELRGHVFNLSHGLLRETPFERVLELVRIVHGVTRASLEA